MPKTYNSYLGSSRRDILTPPSLTGKNNLGISSSQGDLEEVPGIPVLLPGDFQTDLHLGIRVPLQGPPEYVEGVLQLELGQDHYFADLFSEWQQFEWRGAVQLGLSQEYFAIRPRASLGLKGPLLGSESRTLAGGLLLGPSFYIDAKKTVGANVGAYLQGNWGPVGINLEVGWDSAQPQTPFYAGLGVELLFGAISDLGRQDEDYHRFREDPDEREAIEGLDGKLVLPNGTVISKSKDTLVIPEFKFPDSSKFMELVRFAKNLGIPLEVSTSLMGTIFVYTNYKRIPQGLAHFFQYFMNKPEAWDGITYEALPGPLGTPFPTPLERHEALFNRVQNQYVTPADSQSYLIKPLATYVEGDDEQVRVTTVNHFTHKILFQKTYPRKSLNLAGIFQEVASSFDLNQELQEFDKIAAQSAQERKSLDPWWVFRPLPGEEAAMVPRISEEWKRGNLPGGIKVVAPPIRFSVNEAIGVLMGDFNISSEVMEAEGYRPVLIRSNQHIRFEIEKDPKKILKKNPSIPRLKGFSIANIQEFVDELPEGMIGDIIGAYRIVFAPFFAPNTQGPRWRPLVLDLTPIGYGKIEHTFYQEAKLPLDPMGPYRVYVDLGKGFYERNRAKLLQIAGGVEQAEKQFGQHPGQIVQSIYVPDTDEVNMAVSRRHPETIMVYDEALKGGISWENFLTFGRHEVYHSLDFKFGISEDDEFLRWFASLVLGGSSDFFNFINEGYFYERPSGGHAQETVLEFFASLVNSLYSPQLEEKLQGTTSQFRRIYYQSLVKLKKAIVRNVPSQQPLPIVQRIDEVLR